MEYEIYGFNPEKMRRPQSAQEDAEWRIKNGAVVPTHLVAMLPALKLVRNEPENED
jgi:hypothetical protein